MSDEEVQIEPVHVHFDEEEGLLGSVIRQMASDSIAEGCLLIALRNFASDGDSVILGQASRRFLHNHLIVVPAGDDPSFELDQFYREVSIQHHPWPGYSRAKRVDALEQAATDAVRAFASRLQAAYEQSVSNGRSNPPLSA